MTDHTEGCDEYLRPLRAPIHVVQCGRPAFYVRVRCDLRSYKFLTRRPTRYTPPRRDGNQVKPPAECVHGHSPRRNKRAKVSAYPKVVPLCGVQLPIFLVEILEICW